MTEALGGATRISPFAPYNPLLVRSRAIKNTNMRFVGVAANSFSSFTTTNTTDWQDIASRGYEIPMQQCLLQFHILLHVRHSVANATFGFRANMHQPVDGSAGSNATIFTIDNIILPSTASQWMLLSPVLPFAFYLNAATFQPGNHLVAFQLRNYTAGTFSAVQASTTNTVVVMIIPTTAT